MKRLTQDEFVAKARESHGDKYDYSKVEYKNNKTKVCIICPTHGEFWQTPNRHLSDDGCPLCNFANRRIGVWGVGIFDKKLGENKLPSERIWRKMMNRCCSDKFKARHKSYKNVSICDEWLTYSSFKMWFDEHYVEGWDLDKDILVKGNKVYSPQNCCFVPQEVNGLFTNCKMSRGPYPIGVSYKNGRFVAGLDINKKRRHLGSFGTPEEAFQAYKVAKEAYIKEVADKWKDQLEPRVYEALYNYKVEITD